MSQDIKSQGTVNFSALVRSRKYNKERGQLMSHSRKNSLLFDMRARTCSAAAPPWAKATNNVKKPQSQMCESCRTHDLRFFPTQDKNQPKAGFCPSGFLNFCQQKTCAPIRIFFFIPHREWSTAKIMCKIL